MKQKIIGLQRKIHTSQRFQYHSVNNSKKKETENRQNMDDLDNTINQLDLADIFRTLLPTTAE